MMPYLANVRQNPSKLAPSMNVARCSPMSRGLLCGILLKAAPRFLIGVIVVFGFLPVVFSQMKLSPADEMFVLACESINVESVELLQKGFCFRISADKVVVRGPFLDIHKRKLDEKYTVDVGAYLNYINDQLLNRQGSVLEITEITIETGRGGVTARDAPVFSIKMNGTDASGKKIEVEKAAIGPAYSVFKVRNIVNDPIAIRSANVACFAAFLRVTLALDELLCGEVPPRRSDNK